MSNTATISIRPCIWFDYNADEAIEFYTSVFDEASVSDIARYGDAGPGPAGTIMTATLHINGQDFMLLNGGPNPSAALTEGVSFFVSCGDQSQVDHLWERLTSDGGAPSQCGWLRDKFGLSWQIVPAALGEVLGDPDPARSGRAMQAMLKMTKLDIDELRRAASAG